MNRTQKGGHIITSNVRSELRRSLFTALMSAVIIVPIAVLLILNCSLYWEKSKGITIFMLLLAGFGLILFYTAFLNAQSWLHFGETPFELDASGASVGGCIKGKIRVKNYKAKVQTYPLLYSSSGN